MQVSCSLLLLQGHEGVSDGKVCVSCQQPVAAKKAIASSDSINRSLVSGSMWLRVPAALRTCQPASRAPGYEQLTWLGYLLPLGVPKLGYKGCMSGCGSSTGSVELVSAENAPPPVGFAGLSYHVFVSS